MKPYHSISLIFIALLVSCNSNRDILLQVSNPLDQSREDATILLSREEISNWMEIPEDKAPMLLDVNGDAIPSQVDDVDMDGEWDELFALINLPPNGQQKVTLRFMSPDDSPEFEARTNLRLGDASKPGYP